MNDDALQTGVYGVLSILNEERAIPVVLGRQVNDIGGMDEDLGASCLDCLGRGGEVLVADGDLGRLRVAEKDLVGAVLCRRTLDCRSERGFFRDVAADLVLGADMVRVHG